MKFVAKILTIAAALSSLSMAAEKVTVDSSIKPYAPTSGVSGNLNAVGSDTLNNLMTLWAEGFSKKYPSVKIGVEAPRSVSIVRGELIVEENLPEPLAREAELFAPRETTPARVGVA